MAVDAASSQFEVISPIDGRVYLRREYASGDQIQQALNRATQVQQAWRRMPLARRADYCLQMVDRLLADQDAIATELAWMMGRPVRYGPLELAGFAERARTMIALADHALAPLRPPPTPGFQRYIQREPHGVVLVIAPWNYPYLTAVNSLVPALMAGNCVILKHAAQTPCCAERIAAAFEAVGLPEGVFQYLHLRHNDAQTLIQSPQINHICFTGSVAAGRTIEQMAAGSFVGLGLELGGKDPAYIRADANLEQAVASVIDGAFFNAGQSCCAIERIYVERSLFTPFVEQASALIQRYRLGRPDHPDTTLGPMVSAAAAATVRSQISEAIQQGAQPHIPAEWFPQDQPGSAWLAPQLLTGVHHGMRLMHEESFGPVVGVMPVDDDDQAVQWMNDSPFGLTASIYSQDTERGIALGEQLACGTFFLNRCDYLDPMLAWGGIKQSGRGTSLSSAGYEQLTRCKSFHIQEPGP